MSHIVKKNFIYFKGDRERIFITEEQGAKLREALMSENCPKFIEVDNKVFSTNTISSVEEEKEIYQ